MSLPLKSLCVVGLGVVGLVGTLKVIAGPTKIAEFFWFRSLPQRQGTRNFTVQTIERLKANLDEVGRVLQDADARSVQAEEIKRLQAKLEKKDQLIHDLLAEIKQMKTARHNSADSEQMCMLAPPTIVNKADSICVAEVAELIRMLNAHIEQAASHIPYSVTYREPPFSSKELEDALSELTGYTGPWLCNDLRSKSKESSTEPDSLTRQIAIQVGLVTACNHIINNGIPPSDGATPSMLEVVQASPVAQPHTHATTLSQRLEINQKYLIGIALKLISVVGGSLESGEDLLPQYREGLDEIVKRSLALHKALKAISEDAASMMELVTCTVPCNAKFDPSRMEDTEGGGNENGNITQDTVICTVEMGLQCKKRNESGSSKEWGATMKTKVVLASTLE